MHQQMGNEYFQAIYEQYYDRIYQISYFMTRDTYLAEDILQETFMKAYKKIHQITDERKMGAWLSTIASRTAIDVIRKERKWCNISVEENLLHLNVCGTVSHVEQEVEMNMIKEKMKREIYRLKPEYRQVFVLKYHLGLKEEEITHRLHLNKGTVKSRLYRAKQMLKLALAK
jgi:RNA polymerase sigma factor (sigma-70 family)